MQPGKTTEARTIATDRMEAFSDGVFAIAITLLILEIAVPAGSEHHLLESLRAQWPSYLAYVVSFSTIGALWLGHNAITEYLDRADTVLLRANLLLLMVVSFIPFPTKLVAEYVGEAEPERIAVIFYVICLLAATTVLSVLWRYAIRGHLVVPQAGDDEVAMLTQRLTPGLGAYIVMIVLGIFVPIAAVIGCLAIALFFIVPFRFRSGPADRSRIRRRD